MTSTARQGRRRTALAALACLSRFALFTGVATYTGLLLIAIAPVALGLTSTVVLTGSMQPGIAPGDVVLSSRVPASMLRPGQVLLVADPAHAGELLMHRYSRRGPNGSIVTRGDANRVEDSTPVDPANVRGVPRIRVPWVGMPVVWLRLGAPPALAYAGGAVLVMLLLASVPKRKRTRRTGPTSVSARWQLPSRPTAPRVFRVRRAHAAVALLVTCSLASQLTTPGANASFTAEALNPSTFAASSSFYGSTVLDDAPVGYWRGGSLTDVVGGTPATVVGTVSPATGATPDGDPAAYLPSPGWLRLPKAMQGDVTVEFWFATSTGTGAIGPFYSGEPLLHSATASGTGNLGISMTADGHVLAGIGSTTGGPQVTVVSAGSGYADGGWHHLAFVRSQTTGLMELYLDGALSASATGGTQLLDASPYFDLGVSHDRYRYGGDRFDDVSVYAVPLSAVQVAAHFAARSIGYTVAVTADAPAGYWRLDDTTGTTIAATTGTAGSYIGLVARSAAPAVDSGTSVQLNKVGGYALVPRLVSDDFSLELWFKGTIGANATPWHDTAGLLDGDMPNVVNDFGIGLSASGRVVVGVGNPDTSIESAPGFNDNAWHHVVFTRTRATGAIILYVDGAAVASHAGTGNTAALDAAPALTVGRASIYTVYAPSADAVIDEVAQYATVLTPDRVAAHYQRAIS